MHPYTISRSVLNNNKHKKGREIGRGAFGVAYAIID